MATDERTAAMDALIADSADMIDVPASADALGEVERIKYDAAAIEAVQRLIETGKVTLDNEGYLVATAALSAMSPAGEVEQAVLAERERCAKIAESVRHTGFGVPDIPAAGRAIAQAIREPKP